MLGISKKAQVFIVKIALIMSFCQVTYAGQNNSLPLNKVSLMFSADEWVKTDTAKLQVTINATLTKSSLIEMRNKIVQNLQVIAKGEWHITQFSRSQDSSGLEKLYVSAQARVSQSQLVAVNANAKKVSQPGVKYTVGNIDFSPSVADVRKVEANVRQMLYQKIKQEVARLNAVYLEQHFTVYKVMIAKPNQVNQYARRQNPRMNNKMVSFAIADSSAAAISVSNKVKLSAMVTVASNRKVPMTVDKK